MSGFFFNIGYIELHSGEVMNWMKKNEANYNTVESLIQGAKQEFKWKIVNKFAQEEFKWKYADRGKDFMIWAHAEVRIALKKNKNNDCCPLCRKNYYQYSIEEIESGRIILNCFCLLCQGNCGQSYHWKKPIYLIGKESREQRNGEGPYLNEEQFDIYLSILGVKRNELSSERLEDAYKKARESNRPGKNKDDTFAKERLQIIEEAYRTLLQLINK